MQQGIIYDAQARAISTSSDRKPDISILNAVRAYDPRLDIRFNSDTSHWELWRNTEFDIPVYVCDIGEKLDGRIRDRLRDMDTRRDGWETDAYRRMDARIREQKEMSRKHADQMREYMKYINAPDEEAVGVKRAWEIIERENAGKEV